MGRVNGGARAVRALAVMGLGLVALAGCGVIEPEDDVRAATVLASLTINLNDPLNYAAPSYPAHYDANVLNRDNTPANNSVTDEGAALGRVLFYDRELSLNRTKSCASCHTQATGFSDRDVLSEGFDGGVTGSHSMRLGNARFYEGDEMFWDRRADDIEDQVLQPIQDSVEMGFSGDVDGLPALVARLEGIPHYPLLFEWAFGTADVTEGRVQQALAQFVRSLVSTGSRFDTGFAQAGPGGQGGPQALPGFTDQENLGLRLFTRSPQQGGAGCAGCHELPTLALDEDSRSNGLDAGETTVFKSPSLKNVAVGGPFMHDGRFASLEEVVRHYSTGIQAGPALDRRLMTPGGQPIRPNFDGEEVAALVAFMETLTDTDFLSDPRFGDPFRR